MRPAMYGRSAKRPTGRYLSLAEREELAILRAPGGCAIPCPVTLWKGRRYGSRQSRRWASAWSPKQIALRLRLDLPDDGAMRISHEAIYQALCVQSRGALRRELTACLRTGRALQVPRARSRSRGQADVGPEVLISKRPAEVTFSVARHSPISDIRWALADHDLRHDERFASPTTACPRHTSRPPGAQTDD